MPSSEELINVSEIVTGMVLANRISLNSIRPDLFAPPYDKIIELKQKGVSIEEIGVQIGSAPLIAATQADQHLNGAGEAVDWLQNLETLAAQNRAADRMEKLARQLRKGQPLDVTIFHDIVEAMEREKDNDYSRASDVKPMEIPFIPSGLQYLDEHIGGLPEHGLVLVSGNSGVGKTTWALNLSLSFLRQHPDKEVMFFSLEMTENELVMRIKEMYPAGREVPKEILERLLIVDKTLGHVSKAINMAAGIENLGMVVVDFVDLIIDGEISETSMAEAYRLGAIAGKNLGIPFVMLAQYTKEYRGGVPRPYHVRYTKMAEVYSHAVVCLYRPDADYHYWSDDEQELPWVDGRAYIVVWKLRGGFRMNKGPGAIQVQYRGDWGFKNERGRWFILHQR